MATYTTNLNLKKPAGSENVSIGDINNNMDTIDSAVGTLSDQIVAKQLTSSSDINSLESGKYFFASVPSGLPDFITVYSSILSVNKASSTLSFQTLESPNAFAYRYYLNGNWSAWNVFRNNTDAKSVTFDFDYSSGRMTIYFADMSGNSCRLWLTSSGFILQKKAANESNWTTLKTV